MKRRDFLHSGIFGATAGALSFRFEESALAAVGEGAPVPDRKGAPAGGAMPRGKIGKLEIGRLICGGNLTSGFAHSRDLLYVSALLKNYFTDEKIFATWQRCEENGINTAVLRLDDHVIRLISDYWFGEGGKMQWIAQCTMPKKDWKADILRAIDAGAHAAFLHGGVADACVQSGRFDDLARAVELIRQNGVPGGVGGHMVEVPMTIRDRGIPVDFFMKTLNAKNYWSAGPMPRHDSVWEETPEKTIEFMRDVEIPWIAYKVLGAGAIHPREGFRYALENGADFLCVGMFDFQVDEDAALARGLLASGPQRARPWRA